MLPIQDNEHPFVTTLKAHPKKVMAAAVVFVAVTIITAVALVVVFRVCKDKGSVDDPEIPPLPAEETYLTTESLSSWSRDKCISQLRDIRGGINAWKGELEELEEIVGTREWTPLELSQKARILQQIRRLTLLEEWFVIRIDQLSHNVWRKWSDAILWPAVGATIVAGISTASLGGYLIHLAKQNP